MSLFSFLFRLTLGSRLPITDGTLSVSGVRNQITIRRDKYGIPYINAENDQDAWYGLGFCQGQDRAFQIEGMLRSSRGTLSEIAGEKTLPADRLSRRIGFRHSANLHLNVLDPEIREILESFARGITDGFRIGCRRKPHEFILLNIRPTKVTSTDVLAISKLHAFMLSSNWDVELSRYQILLGDGPEAVTDLNPNYPDCHPHVYTCRKDSSRTSAAVLAEDLETLRASVGGSGCSNAWAISGSRTTSKRPILANDPHLKPTMPSHWYLAQISTPEWSVAGATLVGIPTFPSGHNGFAAWGITAGLADNTDLYLEKIGPDGTSVLEENQFSPCESRKEIISVKGKPSVVEDVLMTQRGPIVGPAIGDLSGISLRASWLDTLPFRGLLVLPRINSFEQFRHAFREWQSPSLNMIYADISNTIGWQLVGDVPQRRKGSGALPQPGWDINSGWLPTPVAFEDMPQTSNPEIGVVVSANNQPSGNVDRPFLGIDWMDGYRAIRILESLDSRQHWDVEGTQKLQTDQFSVPWREIRDIVLTTTPMNTNSKLALHLLNDWDGNVTPDSIGASVFELFIAELSRRVARAKAPNSWEWALGKSTNPLKPLTFLVSRRVGHLVRLLSDQPPGWFKKDWPHTIEKSMTSAVETLKISFGTNPSEWKWGSVRPVVFKHPLGEVRFCGSIFNRGPISIGGDTNTISQVATHPINPISDPSAVASLRMVIDVGNWNKSRFVLPGGQSGNPFSPHYDDQLKLWVHGKNIPIFWSQNQIQQQSKTTLNLIRQTKPLT